MTRTLVVLTVLLATSPAAASNVIWADPNTNQILRGAADGSGSAIELFGPADYPGSPGSLLPFGVAVAGGFVYWSDTGTDQILRGAADGSGSAIELFGPADYPGSPGSNIFPSMITFIVPEPSTLTLAAFGLFGLACGRRRRR